MSTRCLEADDSPREHPPGVETDPRAEQRGRLPADPVTAATGIALLRRRGRTLSGEPLHVPRHPVRRESVYGGSVFGVGFGVGATCPGITVAAVATGAWLGFVVLAGILGGLWLRGRVEERRVTAVLTR